MEIFLIPIDNFYSKKNESSDNLRLFYGKQGKAHNSSKSICSSTTGSSVYSESDIEEWLKITSCIKTDWKKRIKIEMMLNLKAILTKIKKIQ